MNRFLAMLLLVLAGCATYDKSPITDSEIERDADTVIRLKQQIRQERNP